MKKALLNLCKALKHERKAHFIPIKTITHHIEMGEICHHIPTVFSTKWWLYGGRDTHDTTFAVRVVW